MKKSLSTLMLLGFLFAFQAMNAQTNLLQGSGMEAADQVSWTVADFSSPDVATWGYAGAPASGSGNSLRVVADHPAAQVQYAVYQSVNLTAGMPYRFDAAVKINGTVRQSWFQVFIGTPNPATLGDYTVPNGTALGTFVDDIAMFASYFGWWDGDTTPPTPDGVFSAGANQKPVEFTPTESGTYYIVVKLGCLASNGHFDVLLDNISFTQQVMPMAAFSASTRSGFAPLTVAFTSTSARATSYEWNFGDGSAVSTQANPSHTYTTAGKYSVSLKVTNEYGNDTKEEIDYIAVQPPQVLTGGGKLAGGNMESAAPWVISYLNTPSGSEPTTTWNYSGENLPATGQGGALRVQINSTAGATLQYCIYQKVTLSADKIYRFNGAFRDNSANLWHFWTEVFLADENSEPQTGNDYGSSNAPMIASIGNWETATSPNRGLDGTYQLNGGAKDFTPAASGDYWFVFKVGVYDNFSADVIIDELLLEEVSPKPYTDFSASNNIGFAPLAVQFANLTRFATSYEWDFGDGSAKSTEANPSHTYATIGTYTVSLKASNAQGDSTMVKTNFVAVNPPEALPEGEKLYGGNMENGNFWNKTPLTGDQSKITLTWNYTGAQPTGGEGGNLRVQIVPHSNAASANIAIWQAIEVKQGYVYDFNGLFKDIGVGSDNFWVQVFMSTERPSETAGDNYSDVDAMSRFHSWTAGYTGKLYDGSFKDGTFVGSAFQEAGGELCSYHHTSANTTMYFILKVGCNGNNVAKIDFLFDNFTLKESLWVPKPKADYTISNSPTISSKVPYTVEFMDNSINATRWEWDFGDGSPIEVISSGTWGDTEHTYTKEGWYTVTLTVYNGSLFDSFTIKDAIQLGPKPNGVPVVKSAEQTVITIGRQINVVSEQNLGDVSIFNIGGQTIQSVRLQGNNFVSDELPQGVYIVKAGAQVHKVIVK